jgi:hypothetical protein
MKSKQEIYLKKKKYQLRVLNTNEVKSKINDGKYRKFTANTPLIKNEAKFYRTKIWNYQNHVHKMIPSFSIIGLSQEFEDMGKKK